MSFGKKILRNIQDHGDIIYDRGSKVQRYAWYQPLDVPLVFMIDLSGRELIDRLRNETRLVETRVFREVFEVFKKGLCKNFVFTRYLLRVPFACLRAGTTRANSPTNAPSTSWWKLFTAKLEKNARTLYGANDWSLVMVVR